MFYRSSWAYLLQHERKSTRRVTDTREKVENLGALWSSLTLASTKEYTGHHSTFCGD